MIWHVRLGHAYLNYLSKMQKFHEIINKVKFKEDIPECEMCILAKMEKLPFKEIRVRATKPLERIHTDLMGPIKPESFPDHCRYLAVFIDDYSRFAQTYPMRHKNESGDCLEKFLITTRNLLAYNAKACYIRTDKGTEFTGGKFSKIMKLEKIEGEFTPANAQEHNGSSERFNKTLQWKIRAQMIDSAIPKHMWPHEANAAVHIYNRTPHSSINFQTPLSQLNPERKLHLGKIRRFGCISFVKLINPETKFSDRAIRAIFLGYSTTGYVLWNPENRKILESRHVRCNEKIVYKDKFNTPTSTISLESTTMELEPENIQEPIENTTPKTSENYAVEEADKSSESVQGKPKNAVKRKLKKSKELETVEPIRKQPKGATTIIRKTWHHLRQAYVPRELEDISTKSLHEDEPQHVFIAKVNNDPTNFKEAMESDEKFKWMKAIEEEFKSMEENNVWTEVVKPETDSTGKRINVIDSRWLFKRKLDENGGVIHKARLVIRGFKDKNEYSLLETYAPVLILPIVRTVLAIINKLGLTVWQMDVKTAFLNGKLEEEIYMKIPDGYKCKTQCREKPILKITRSMYGLRKSAKSWNECLKAELLELRLEQDINETYLFT